MSNYVYRDGVIKYCKKKEGRSVKCPTCGFEVVAKTVREAIITWNTLSDKNIKENHDTGYICKHCGAIYLVRPSKDDNVYGGPANDYDHLVFLIFRLTAKKFFGNGRRLAVIMKVLECCLKKNALEIKKNNSKK